MAITVTKGPPRTLDRIYREHVLAYRPHWPQYDFHRARKFFKYRWMSAGIGTGKSVAGMMEDLFAGGQIAPGSTGLMGVPDYMSFREINLPIMEQFWPKGTWRLSNKGNQPQIHILWGDGCNSGYSPIFIRTASSIAAVKRWDGPTVRWAHLDEPSRMTHGSKAFDKALGRTRQAGPLQGHIWITGSPRGGNWLAKAWGVAHRLPRHAWRYGAQQRVGHYVRAARTEDNPYNPPEYAQALRAHYGPLFARQECDGDIVADAGMIYGGFYRAVHVLPNNVIDEIWHRAVHNRGGGGDWGFRDPAALVVCGIDGDKNHYIVDEWYHSGKTHREQGIAALGLMEKWGIPSNSKWYMDPSRPGLLLDWLYGYEWQGKTYVIPAVGADNAWLRGINSVRTLLHLHKGHIHPLYCGVAHIGAPRLYVAERCVHLIDEAEKYQIKQDDIADRPDGPQKEDETDGHDHLLDSLRYYVQGEGQVFESMPETWDDIW